MLVLFDLDGTLLDSLDAWAAAYRKAIHPRVITDDQIVRDLFHSTPESLARHGITDTGEYYASLTRFLKDNAHLVSVAAYADAALGKLEGNGHTLGVLTSRTKELATIHCPPELLSKFQVIIDREDALPKPQPQGVFRACEHTGIPVNQTVLVGDHPTDALCAQNAGIHFLLYKPNDHAFRNHPELAHVTSFSSFKELPRLVNNLSRRSP